MDPNPRLIHVSQVEIIDTNADEYGMVKEDGIVKITQVLEIGIIFNNRLGKAPGSNP